MPDLPWEPQNPYLLYGNARSVSAGAVLTATNRRTGETQTVVVEPDGSYLVDCANFDPGGYADHDPIELRVSNDFVLTSVNIGGFPDGRRVDISPARYNCRRRPHDTRVFADSGYV